MCPQFGWMQRVFVLMCACQIIGCGPEDAQQPSRESVKPTSTSLPNTTELVRKANTTKLVRKAIRIWRDEWKYFEITIADVIDFGVVGSDRIRFIAIYYEWETRACPPNQRANWRLIVFDRHEKYLGFSSVSSSIDKIKSGQQGDQLLLSSKDGDDVHISTVAGRIVIDPEGLFVGPFHGSRR